MKVAKSRLTAQNQVVIPAEIRRRLGLAPGAIIEWDAEGETVIVRRACRYTSGGIHQAIFPDGPPSRRSPGELKEAIRKYMRERHVRR